MSPRGKVRWFLWILGVGAFAALATVGVSWKDIVMRYRLERLRRNSTSLLSLLNAPDVAANKLAARDFAREPHGQEAVVSLFLDYFEKARAETIRERGFNSVRGGYPSWEGTPGPLGDLETAIVGFRGGAEAPAHLMMFWGELRWKRASQNGLFVSDNDITIVVALAELLLECRDASLDLPHYPGLTVEVLPIESASDRAKRWTKPLKPLQGSYGPVDGSKPPQNTVLLFSRIVP